MSPLEEPAGRAVVRIGPAAGGYDGRHRPFWGSGFFVAPDWVLTCAHVVVTGEAGVRDTGTAVRVGVTADDGVLHEGRVAAVLDAQDLALVHVPGAGRTDCLWLGDRPDCTPAEVGLFGWARTQDAAPEFYAPSGLATGGRRGNPMTLQGTMILPGCSGGPVVDARHGAVIGVIKGRGQGDSTIGRAVPVSGLRALADDPESGDAALWHTVVRDHDRHHLARYSGTGDCWPRIQIRLAAHGGRHHLFTPDARVRLYGLFAELPPPPGSAHVLALVNEARRHVLRGPRREDGPAPCDWRDGTGLLYDPRDATEAAEADGRDLELEAVVVYAAMVHAHTAKSGGPAVAALRDWVAEATRQLRNDVIREQVPGLLAGAHRHTGDTPGPGADGDDVLVVVEPELFGTHRWQVRLVGADGRTRILRNDDEGVPPERLESSLRAALTAAVAQADAGEHLAAVDFLLPRVLFDEPVEQWRLRLPRPGEPPSVHSLPIGRRRVVALRDQLRRRDGATPEWHRGWSAVEQGPLAAVPLCHDVPAAGHRGTEQESEEAAYTRLLDQPPGAVPVHCASTARGRGSAVLTRAFHAGHAAVICRRAGEQDHEDCAEFHERAARLVRDAGTGRALRERVRALRNLSAAPDGMGADAAWARHIVLIYDPPHRPVLPNDPSCEPPL